MNDAGRIGFVIRDDYDNNVQYDFLDVVYYHGNSYVAKKLTLGNIPNENNEYWHIFAAGGVRVKGDAETEYRTGDVNITKENIGLANTEDKSSETIRGEITSENVTNALGYTPMNEDLDTYGQKESPTGSEKVIVNDDGEVKQVEMSKVKPAVMQGATQTTPGESGLVPAPGAGNNRSPLLGNGEFKNLYSTGFHYINSAGWFRFLRWTEQTTQYHKADTASLCGVINISRRWTDLEGESMVLTIASAHNVGWSWHLINAKRAVKQIEKIRVSKKEGDCYLEFYASRNERSRISIDAFISETPFSNDFDGYEMLPFEPAESDETVVSEYTIPDKDDISTSKRLTNFEEIPEGADMNTYLTPGNYACSDSNKATALKNCPLKTAFTLEVSYGINDKNYIFHRYYAYAGETVAVKLYSKYSGAFGTTKYYYPSIGTPPANKLWGTDANGNVGWIDPP